MTKQTVSYIRVSTARQGTSRLGLEAQQTAVRLYAAAQNAEIIAEFTEIETGKSADRPQLAAAIRQARACGATLVIAKLDRLARNVAFTSAMMDSGLEFVALDCPHASRLVLHVMCAFAEHEVRQISERTKAALAAARARGTKLGAASPNSAFRRGARRGWKAGSERSAAVRARRLEENYGRILPTMKAMREAGQTLEQVATWLNREGYRTTRGREFGRSTVLRALARAVEAAQSSHATQIH